MIRHVISILSTVFSQIMSFFRNVINAKSGKSPFKKKLVVSTYHFPVMAGKNDIVFPTFPTCQCCEHRHAPRGGAHGAYAAPRAREVAFDLTAKNAENSPTKNGMMLNNSNDNSTLW